MTNLEYLFSTDLAFRDIVIEAAAAAIGTTNPEFAEEWLERSEHADDYDQQRIDKLVKQRDEARAEAEDYRARSGKAADFAGAIMRVCMDCTDYAVVDMDGEVIS